LSGDGPVTSGSVPGGAPGGAAAEAAAAEAAPGAARPADATTARAGARSYRKAALAVVLLALVWGYSWVVMKIGLNYSEPFTFAALRTFLGAIPLFILLPILGRPLRPKALGFTAVLGVVQTTGFVGLLTWALVEGAAGKTSILTYTMPFWLLLMAWVFLGEKLKGFQWVAVGLALCGLILLLAPWRLEGRLSEVFAIGGALCWAGSAILAKLLRKRHEVDLLSLTAWQLLLGSLPLVIVAIFTWSESPVWSGTFIAVMVYVVFLGSALAWVLWLYILNALPAGTAGLATLLTPVIGIVSAWIQLGERPSLTDGLGMLAVVGALLLTTLRGILAGRKGSAAITERQTRT
jgi:drug/metabolite transporter (DMT)-like permease